MVKITLELPEADANHWLAAHETAQLIDSADHAAPRQILRAVEAVALLGILSSEAQVTAVTA